MEGVRRSARDHGRRDRGVPVAETGDRFVAPIIETDDAFEAFRGALITNAGAVIRIATPRVGTLGVFAGPDPEADRILAAGDPLLGSTVREFGSNPVSVNAA